MSKRRPLYSRSGKPRAGGRSGFAALPNTPPLTLDLSPEARGPTLRQRIGAWLAPKYRAHQGKVLLVASALIALGIVGLYDVTRPAIPRTNDPHKTHLTNREVQLSSAGSDD